METYNLIKENIKHILEISENSRNSDTVLVANYWVYYDKDELLIHETIQYLPLVRYAEGKMTSPSVIERTRRLIQEECGLLPDQTEAEKSFKLEQMKRYLPTDIEVLKARRIKSVMWKEYINQNKIKNVMEAKIDDNG